MIAAARAVIGSDRDRDHAAQKNEEDFLGVAEAAQEHGDRDERRLWQRIKQFHQRIDEDIEKPPARHEESEPAAAKNGEEKPDRSAIERSLRVVDKFAASDQIDPGDRHLA